MVPPKKPQAGVAQSSLVQASVATMQNPMGCELKTNDHCPMPRLSISSRSASIVASMDAVVDGSALHSVMKWKTVLTVFIVVVLYLVGGGLVFQALEQHFESDKKNTITQEKALFLQRNPCVSSAELEALIKVSAFNKDSIKYNVCTQCLRPNTYQITGTFFLDMHHKTGKQNQLNT